MMVPVHERHGFGRLAPLLAVLLTIGWAGCGDGDNQAPASSDTVATTETPPASSADTTRDDAVAKINLNTGTAEQFRTIPGVGDRMVSEFEEYRPYGSIRQFRSEMSKYVSGDEIAAYERYVYVPVDPNESDAETLGQLPGVTPDEAAAIIAGRPYASRNAFLEKLTGYVKPEELAQAESYLAGP